MASSQTLTRWHPCPVCAAFAPTTAEDRRTCILCRGGRYVADCVYQRWILAGRPMTEERE